MKKLLFSLLLIQASITTAFAFEGDAAAGKAKAAMCAACHGADGIGTTDTYPNLAGQHASYIAKQLQAFKDGSRKDPVMAPMAMGLSDQDMKDLGAYFQNIASEAASGDASAGTSTAVAAGPVFEADPAIGKSLFELGDDSRAIPACIGCHGKDGNSEVLIYPNLADQHPEYIEKQLRAFKSGDRIDAQMNPFAKPLTDEEIKHIGAYFADTDAVANVKARKPAGNVMTESAVAGKAKAASCAACHGNDGNSMITTYPKLAGQGVEYIVKQLKEFKDGTRKDPVMAPMAVALSDQDMFEIASFFAAQKPAKGTGEDNERGRLLYQEGDVELGITACAACHGADGKGMTLAGFPGLNNQHVDYVKAQLTKFRSSERDNDRNSMMRSIAEKIENDNDIDALAQYISSLK